MNLTSSLPRVVLAVNDAGLEGYLRSLPEFTVTAKASDREDFIRLVQSEQPDLAVFAYILPGDIPIEEMPQRIKDASSSTRVIWILNDRDSGFTSACNAIINTGYYDIFNQQLKTSHLREAMFSPMRYEDVAHLHAEDDSKYIASHNIQNLIASDVSDQAGAEGSALRPLMVAVWSPKGGDGATSIATRLALYASNQGISVGLYDFNLMHSHVAFQYNLDIKEGLERFLSQSDLEPDWTTVMKVMQEHRHQGIHVFPGLPRHPELADRVNKAWFDTIFENTRNHFTLSIFDLHPDLDKLPTFLALKQSPIILTVATQDSSSIHEALKQLSILRRLNIPSRRVRLVLNRYMRGIQNLDASDIGEYLNVPVMATIPENYKDYVLQSRDKAIKYPEAAYKQIMTGLFGRPLKKERRFLVF